MTADHRTAPHIHTRNGPDAVASRSLSGARHGLPRLALHRLSESCIVQHCCPAQARFSRCNTGPLQGQVARLLPQLQRHTCTDLMQTTASCSTCLVSKASRTKLPPPNSKPSQPSNLTGKCVPCTSASCSRAADYQQTPTLAYTVRLESDWSAAKHTVYKCYSVPRQCGRRKGFGRV
jgi:hypothetical protein